jgi:nucleotide-binding universal stress UspA family protein
MTALRSILLHLDASPDQRHRLAVAAQLAASHSARLSVLYAVMPVLMQYPFAMSGDGAAVAQLAQWEADARSTAQAAFARDAAVLGLADVAWQVSEDEPVRALRSSAWAHDLLVLTQHNPNAAQPSGVPSDAVAALLVGTGKPALVLPYTGGASTATRRVLVAWKPTPESARALTAALPLLQRADEVHLACWDDGGLAGADAAVPALQFLQHHGITATVHDGGPAGADVGELLLSRAADLQSDLLVMGCYGHGRAREWALGGATRTVLASMTLPVLMAH